MKAVEVLQKLQNEEFDFESEYTSLSKTRFDVHDDKVFEDLSQEDKLKYSNIAKMRPILNIFKNTWMYIEEFNMWLLIGYYNTWNSHLSYLPDFVFVNENTILHIESEKLFEKI